MLILMNYFKFVLISVPIQILADIPRLFLAFFLLVQSTEDYINLSSRMAVMTEGRVACLSSPPVLMKKHGLGYTVVVAFQTDETVNVHSQMSFFTCAVETFTKVEVCLF